MRVVKVIIYGERVIQVLIIGLLGRVLEKEWEKSEGILGSKIPICIF